MKYVFIISIYLLTLACGKDAFEPYNNPYVHIMKDGVETTTVSAAGNFIGTYTVYLSSASLTEALTVEYEFIIGEGLKEGVDYELLTTGRSLTFLPGIYDMPIRVRWIANPIDKTQNNTFTIRLVNNNLGFTLGLPGPDEKQKEFVITKTN